MLNKLTTFYKANGILSTSFTCPHQSDCKNGNDKFTGPKAAFVSSGYETRKLPRLLFLSLDTGDASNDAQKKLPLAVRKKLQGGGYRNKKDHWFRTHELAWYILKRFDSRLTIKDTSAYFAHANSAKCCMNNPGNKVADSRLFINCRGYLKGELAILEPEIIVTQGDAAKHAINKINDEVVSRMDDFAAIIVLNGKGVFWLHTYHPMAYGSFHRQRNDGKPKKYAHGWQKYAEVAHKFITENYS